MIDLESVRENLNNRLRSVLKEPSLKPAAVLMPYFIKDGNEHLLLTVRSDKVANHKGQIAFPGGHQEPGENLQHTALRESFEEVGIRPEDVDIIGPTDDIVTITSFRVTPFLGKIPYPYEFKRSKDEIAEIIEVPIDVLLDEKNITKNIISSSQGKFAVYYFSYGEYVIWGATGRILAELLNLLFGKDL